VNTINVAVNFLQVVKFVLGISLCGLRDLRGEKCGTNDLALAKSDT
jgi:hypothetical protein